MRVLLLLLIALSAPASAYHQGREALACFWAMLPVAMLFGPDFGLRLLSHYPSAVSSTLLTLSVIGFSWSTFFSTTWLCASVLELGMESGGAGLLAGHFAGGLPPWLASRWFPRPILPVVTQ